MRARSGADIRNGPYSAAVFDFVFAAAGGFADGLRLGFIVDNKSHILNFASRPVVAGITRFCFGLAKKNLLAVPMGGIADAAFAAGPGSLTAFSAWIGVIAFAFQVYFLFSAFVDMAGGLMGMFGFKVGEDFDSPYQADGITDFWRRWFVPVGEGRSRVIASVLVTLLVGMLWRGASGGLVVWGLLHGLMLWIERATGGRAFYAGLAKPIRAAITFFILLIAWVFFRADSPGEAGRYLQIMIGQGPPLAPTAALLDADMLRNFNTMSLIVCALVVWAVPNTAFLLRKPAWWKTACGIVVAGLAVLMFQDRSTGAAVVHPRTQEVLTRFGEGNGAVHIGISGWLFPRREIASLTGEGLRGKALSSSNKHGTLKEILELAAALKERGVPLILVPVPVKSMIYPERLSSAKFDAPVHHPDQRALQDLLRSRGIDVIDLAPEMWRLKLRKQVFLQQDTHWTPDAMKLMAETVAKHIRTKYPQALTPPASTPLVDARIVDRTSFGDLVGLLRLPSPASFFVPEQVTLVSVSGFEPSAASSVLLLGDSFVRVFDDPALGFAAAGREPEPQRIKAGFADQLAILLNEPLDVIAVRGDARAARRELAQRSDDGLSGKSLAIWVMAGTELLAGVENDVE